MCSHEHFRNGEAMATFQVRRPIPPWLRKSAWREDDSKSVNFFRRSLENTGGALENTGEQTQAAEPENQKSGCRAFTSRKSKRKCAGHSARLETQKHSK